MNSSKDDSCIQENNEATTCDDKEREIAERRTFCKQKHFRKIQLLAFHNPLLDVRLMSNASINYAAIKEDRKIGETSVQRHLTFADILLLILAPFRINKLVFLQKRWLYLVEGLSW